MDGTGNFHVKQNKTIIITRFLSTAEARIKRQSETSRGIVQGTRQREKERPKQLKSGV